MRDNSIKPCGSLHGRGTGLVDSTKCSVVWLEIDRPTDQLTGRYGPGLDQLWSAGQTTVTVPRGHPSWRGIAGFLHAAGAAAARVCCRLRIRDVVPHLIRQIHQWCHRAASWTHKPAGHSVENPSESRDRIT
jgi:hypothetical protein